VVKVNQKSLQLSPITFDFSMLQFSLVSSVMVVVNVTKNETERLTLVNNNYTHTKRNL